MTRNLGLKALSLLIAIVLAYVVNSDRNTSVITVIIPVEIQNIPTGKVLVAPSRRELQVTLRGPTFIVGPISSSPPVARVRMPETVSQRFKATFTPGDFSLPNGVDVLSIEPPDLELMFDDLVTRDVYVEVPRMGRLRDDYKLDGIELDPQTVTLTGPANEVKDVQRVETSPIDLGAFGETREIELALRPPGILVSVQPRRVLAKIRVSPQLREKRFVGRPVEVRLGAGAKASDVAPRVVDVIVSGPAPMFESLDASAVLPYVRVAEDQAKGDTGVLVDLPTGISLVRVEPPTVRLTQVSVPAPIPAPRRGKK